ncbi:MAG: ABC transporter ATP-binding protein [Planctomycetota bacterium]|nr:ABC transporter ATP-binding protein [Planctomycetota bacterium]
MLKAEALTKRFKKNRVLDELALDLAPGAVTVLLGANGAGKSTLLKLALGVLKADAGSLAVCGMDPVKHGRRVRQAVGYVPDRPDVYDWMTPRELYRFLKPQYPTWNADKVASASAALGVPMDRAFGALSRGEGMKAMLVAALAHDPQLLLLDEPFAGLDPVVREEVLRGIIAELRADERTVLCATHDLDVAARIADRVAVLSKGAIAEHGTLDEVLGGDQEIGRVPDRMRLLLMESVA